MKDTFSPPLHERPVVPPLPQSSRHGITAIVLTSKLLGFIGISRQEQGIKNTWPF